PVNYVTIGMNKTMLIVGLGNIGAEYDGTRHNIGFDCVDAFAKTNSLDAWILKKDLKCRLTTGRIGEVRVYAIKPTTFMNLSGEAIQAVASFYRIPVENTVVVHDELDIDFGQLRLRVGGSAAGHNGIKSVSQHIGEDYARIRIGIGPKHPARIASEKFVLQAFSAEEQAQIANMTQEVNAVLSEFVYGGQLPNETRSFLV
ncbi:MAG: aminoacyl-tRNA hydrolase, partial [Candidatus Saccharimonadales bacterium]